MAVSELQNIPEIPLYLQAKLLVDLAANPEYAIQTKEDKALEDSNAKKITDNVPKMLVNNKIRKITGNETFDMQGRNKDVIAQTNYNWLGSMEVMYLVRQKTTYGFFRVGYKKVDSDSDDDVYKRDSIKQSSISEFMVLQYLYPHKYRKSIQKQELLKTLKQSKDRYGLNYVLVRDSDWAVKFSNKPVSELRKQSEKTNIFPIHDMTTEFNYVLDKWRSKEITQQEAFEMLYYSISNKTKRIVK